VVAAGTLTEQVDGTVTAHILGLIGSEHQVAAVLGPAAVLAGEIIESLTKDPASLVNLRPTPVGAAINCQAGKSTGEPIFNCSMKFWECKIDLSMKHQHSATFWALCSWPMS
jgi:hypothetical protein